MFRFNNDYNIGAIPEILEAFNKTNGKAYAGYGLDECSKKAAKLIKERLKAKNSDVHLLIGGTQTNFVVIDSVLKPYEGVISADTGHIEVHECGAIESCGHKILTVPHKDGKISAAQVAKVAQDYKDSTIPEHITVPRMVYISFPTEYGTIYSKKELSDLYKVCKKYKLYLYIDGARLSYGLGAKGNDLKFEDFAKLCDAFYIGGTKCGALFGEALVINNDELKPYFRNMMKQNGAILAKGWLLGLQFIELFKDDRYFKLGKEADLKADKIRAAFLKKKQKLFIPNKTNQVFVILDNSMMKKLSKNFIFEFEETVDKNHTCVRFCTSWASSDEAVDALVKEILN